MKYFNNIFKIIPIVLILIMASCNSCSDSDNGYQVEPGNGGYIFAHMTDANYGSLYYSVSRDGITWKTLNDGQRINNEYRGHPDICVGREGQYYMIGIETTGKPVLWRSNNMIGWAVEQSLPESAFNLDAQGHFTETLWYGAPKMYFDTASDQYIITWHAANKNFPSGNDMWRSMRTFYILTKDFKTFTAPQRLFNFTNDEDKDMGIIDTIIRKINGVYYAFIKDERWPEDTPTGKTIRMTKSTQLTTGYENPSAPLTPNWHEAPILVPQPNSSAWYLYAEQYPNIYVLFSATSIDGPYTPREIKAPDGRHGAIIWVDESTYVKVVTAYHKAAQ